MRIIYYKKICCIVSPVKTAQKPAGAVIRKPGQTCGLRSPGLYPKLYMQEFVFRGASRPLGNWEGRKTNAGVNSPKCISQNTDDDRG